MVWIVRYNIVGFTFQNETANYFPRINTLNDDDIKMKFFKSIINIIHQIL